jgi:RNA polymerase sigma-70 factor (family 1)
LHLNLLPGVQSSEKEVFKAIQTGDEKAFEMMFRKFYQPLCRYAYSYVSDHEEAEEIVQASFIGIWEKRQSIDIATSLKAYLYRSVRNASLNVIKHGKVKQVYLQQSEFTVEKTTEATEQALITDELEQKIFSAIQTLPEQCRLIFKLSRFEEMKYQEIADQLNISIKTVENQMGKALKIMREQLREYLPLIFIFMKGLLDP